MLKTINKLRTMYVRTHKVSKVGAFLCDYKLDKLTQLLNVMMGV